MSQKLNSKSKNDTIDKNRGNEANWASKLCAQYLRFKSNWYLEKAHTYKSGTLKKPKEILNTTTT